MQLIQTIHGISKSLDKKETVDMAIMDSTKAFDKVPHKRLIHKLNYYGISGYIATWIETFLIRRTQQVVVNGATSSYTIVTFGVPQGTVLGPLFFLLHINDLPDILSTSWRIYLLWTNFDVCRFTLLSWHSPITYTELDSSDQSSQY